MKDLIQLIDDFRDTRDWRQFHNEKDLALSIVLEAAELLENFQWKSSEESLAENCENIKEELADVLIYSLMLASNLKLDVGEIIRCKLKNNDEKYPVSKARGNKAKYDSL